MTSGKAWPSDSDTPDMVNTFRVPQPLNGRPVTRSIFAEDGGSHTDGDDDDALSGKGVLQSSALCLVAAAVGKLLLH